jgi:hypothetical protein
VNASKLHHLQTDITAFGTTPANPTRVKFALLECILQRQSVLTHTTHTSDRGYCHRVIFLQQLVEMCESFSRPTNLSPHSRQIIWYFGEGI